MEKNNALDSVVKYVHYSVNFLKKTDEFDVGFALENGKEYPLKDILYCLAYVEKYDSSSIPPMKGYYYELLSENEKKLFSDVVMQEYIHSLWLSASKHKNSSMYKEGDDCYKDFFYFKALNDGTFNNIEVHKDLPLVKWLKNQISESENFKKIIDTYCYDNEQYIGSISPLNMEWMINNLRFEDFKFAYHGLKTIHEVVGNNQVYKDVTKKDVESVYINKFSEHWSNLSGEEKLNVLNESKDVIFYAMDMLKKNEGVYSVMKDIFNFAIENNEKLSHKAVMQLTNKLTNMAGDEKRIQDKLYPIIEWSGVCNKLIKESHFSEGNEDLYRIEVSYTNLLMLIANLPKFINIPSALGMLEEEDFEVSSSNKVVERLDNAIQDLKLLLSCENPELLHRITIDDKKSGLSRFLLEVSSPSKSEKDFLKSWVKTGLYKSDSMRKKGKFTSMEVESYYSHMLMEVDLKEKDGLFNSKLKVRKF